LRWVRNAHKNQATCDLHLFRIFVTRRPAPAASNPLSRPAVVKESLTPTLSHGERQASSAFEAKLNTSLVKFETLASKSDDRRMQIWQEKTCRQTPKSRPRGYATGRAIPISLTTYGNHTSSRHQRAWSLWHTNCHYIDSDGGTGDSAFSADSPLPYVQTGDPGTRTC
jgi:hypothetical protein